jgi:hypothetical protein
MGVPSAKGKRGGILRDDVDLPEAATVVSDPEDSYSELTAEEQAELETAIGAADRGEGVPWQAVRDQLRRRHR